jgi:hypothetical protein
MIQIKHTVMDFCHVEWRGDGVAVKSILDFSYPHILK